MLNQSVLVLNRSYMPIHVTSARRAFALLYTGIAKAVNEQYELFDFESWSELSVRTSAESVGVVDGRLRIPRVILIQVFDKIPKRHVRFSRINIYARDRNTCQYCGKRHSRSDLNLDHVVPRTQGGRSTWDNVVCSCVSCNRKKGGRTPAQAAMRLVRTPVRPRWSPLLSVINGCEGYPEWRPFLSVVDASYWNAELVEK